MTNNRPDILTQQAIEADGAHMWHHLTQHQPLDGKAPLMVVEGKGMRVWDASGREHLDAVSGAVWTVNVGYGRESIAKAVYDQLIKMNYFANSAGNVPGGLFAERLIEKMPGLSRVYYSNSGSEANEKGYKLVRQLAALKNDGKKHKILYRDRDYHGTTITALSSTGQLQRKDQYGPFTPGFVEVPHCMAYRSPNGDDPDFGVQAACEIEKVILREDPDTVGSIILEPITAGGGVIPPPEGYFETVQEICAKYGVLLHIDEVVCGMGRTGKWFGYQHYGVKPDIVTMAKGVASGYAAISVTATTEALFNEFLHAPAEKMNYFRDISTFGGCAGGPAAALENLRIIEEENLLQNVTNMGEYFMGRFAELQDKYPVIGDVRGVGLFMGLELVKDRKSKEPVDESVTAGVVADCMQQGVIIGRTNRSFETFNNTLCFSPALICTKDDADQIVEAVDNALAKVVL
ncbi:aspartate aminotransferase family protein [Leucothrix pacifica]|uniref:Aspartate aminotransferase family protein n=1 Tax=Leucothrix pacifica TaxID=1247513 RepID=A0A317CP83_9GAMM|nr:aminotransferase class III-fold pyridoxal phosphate-dependent enzyme [Leucothrix pacifica]PWQ98150.1 aspartate aminotransferase family protein [Leucothrix pacifica]